MGSLISNGDLTHPRFGLSTVICKSLRPLRFSPLKRMETWSTRTADFSFAGGNFRGLLLGSRSSNAKDVEYVYEKFKKNS